MDASLLCQDNVSATLLETNSKASSSKQIKHIKIKYFFVKDKINKVKVVVKHFPTKQMRTDTNTKANEDRYQHQTKSRSGILSLPRTHHGHPSG